MRALLIVIAILAALPARAADIAIALTDDFIRVDTGFAGARLVLFGAVTGIDDPENTVDIISVVRGPETRFDIRRLEKRNLIWMPGEARAIDGAPGLYLTSATKNITDIAPLPDQAAHHLGADHLDIQASPATQTPDQITDTSENELFKNAFLNEVEDLGLYRNIVGGVDFKKSGLFTINVNLPATTPVGDYAVSVYLYRNGELLGEDTAQLAVNKVGAERRIYELAHNRPVSYGVFCVILSLFAGWAASLAFRK